MTVTPFDDYPIHQTPLPVTHTESGDRNHYDRYFFNGFDRDGSWYFAIAMGLYPNRRVIDAAFSFSRDGVQRSVYASGRAPVDRSQTRIGPIRIEIVEPLRVNRVRVEAAHLGLSADLTWEPRTIAVEEPRQTLLEGPLVTMDSTRLTQWGTWRGEIVAGDRTTHLDKTRVLGTKDRSWGIRPVGEPAPGAPPAGPAGGGIFFLWGPVHFERRCTHLVLFEYPDGTRWYEDALSVPIIGEGDATWGFEHTIRHARSVDYKIQWRSGTRRSRGATLDYVFRDGGKEQLVFEPLLDFQMKGIGYLHPTRGHGTWQGESVEAYEEFNTADIDPLALPNLHVQQLCRVTSGAETGIGVLEQLPLGPHAPTGLTGFMDGAP